MGMIQEFKKFALRGNVVDLAVGIIIGGAFGTIVKSLVDDVIMPPLGMLTSDVNVKGLAYTLRPTKEVVVDGVTTTVPAVVINYGAFLNHVITFLIVAWAVFMLVKAMNVAESKLRLGTEPPADAPPPPEEVLLLRQIRDELKKA
jgi:large conductance mechanosensitive channel